MFVLNEYCENLGRKNPGRPLWGVSPLGWTRHAGHQHSLFCSQEYNLQLSSSERNVSRSRWPADTPAGRRVFGQCSKGFASPEPRSPAARLDALHPRTPRFGPVSLSFAPESLFRLVDPPARPRLRNSLMRKHLWQKPHFGSNRVRKHMEAGAGNSANRSTKAKRQARISSVA